MKLIGYAFAAAAGLIVAASGSNAATIDYSGAGTFNYEVVSQNFGDTAGVDVTYRTLNGGNNWGQTATEFFPPSLVYYWNDANYSGDQAVFAEANGNKLAIDLVSTTTDVFTSMTFRLGSWPNFDRNIEFRIFDAAWNAIAANVSLLVDDVLGATITLSGLSTSAIHFQMGDDWDVGVNSITYETGPSRPTEVPLPGALLFLGSGLLGLAGVSLRRKRS